MTGSLPGPLADLVGDFAALSAGDRLQLLVEIGDELPALPEHVAARRGDMEPVAECQSPVFVLAELDDGDRVRVHVSAPSQAPTTRGFAAVMCLGLDRAEPGEVLAVPDDVSALLGLGDVVSPLRLRGMNGLLRRIKRQVAHLLEQTGKGAHDGDGP